MDDTDYLHFLNCLKNVCKRTGWRIHAYVLMPNHYHLLVETVEANLVVGMHWLQGTYTIRYNWRHKLHGHLFQGRYKALLVDPKVNQYFLKVSTYIHLNPIRAKLINIKKHDLKTYDWSSYPYYIRAKRFRPAYLDVNRVLGNLWIDDDVKGRRYYKSYMLRRAKEASTPNGRERQDKEWKMIRHGWCLGSDMFKTEALAYVNQKLEHHQLRSYSGHAVRAHGKSQAEQLVKMGLDCLQIAKKDLVQLHKKDKRKQALAWYIRRNTVVSNEWISRMLIMGHQVNVSKSVSEVEKSKDKETLQFKNKLNSSLNNILKSKD